MKRLDMNNRSFVFANTNCVKVKQFRLSGWPKRMLILDRKINSKTTFAARMAAVAHREERPRTTSVQPEEPPKWS